MELNSSQSLQKDEASVAFYFAFRNTNCTANKRIRQSGNQILSTIDRKVFVSLREELRIKSWKFKGYVTLLITGLFPIWLTHWRLIGEVFSARS